MTHLTSAEQANIREAFALLDLIDAEFRTDPTSTQCFDARIVERVRGCVARRKDFEKRSMLGTGPEPNL